MTRTCVVAAAVLIAWALPAMATAETGEADFGWLSVVPPVLAIGLAHALLLANNDVLRIYAVCGLLLPIK